MGTQARPACVVKKRELKARFPAKPEGFARTSNFKLSFQT